jgi:hypothetical protein
VKRGLVLLALAGCDDLAGFTGEPPPFATLQVQAVGDAPGAELRVALVWGALWLPEPLCFLPAESPEVAAVLAAGCRDLLGFTPARAAVTVPLTPGATNELPVAQLPSADAMVGDLTARVGYASLVVFEDGDADGELTLGLAPQLPAGAYDGGGFGDLDEEGVRSPDIVRGASFVSMTAPDRRVAFREGGFVETGFYPRRGCAAPPAGYSVVSAGGFTLEAALAATLAGELPAQDPATCAEDAPPATVVEIALRDPAEVAEVACEQRWLDSSVRYRDPPAEAPVDLAQRPHACAAIPTFDDDDPGTAGITQLVIAGDDGECKGLTHYTLVGCDDGGLLCDRYEWDLRATPPAWWPCE